MEKNPEEPHDVLAADEFGVGAQDGELHDEREGAAEGEPHDVLAADEFELPAPDPALHHEDLHELPPDLAGDRDVLVAEEFAMPSPDEAHASPLHAHHEAYGHQHDEDCDHDHFEIDLVYVAGAVAALAALFLLGRRRCRRREARHDLTE